MPASTSHPTHRVAVLALDGVLPSDLSAPCDIFSRVCTPEGRPAYELLVCGPDARVRAGAFDVLVPHRLDVLRRADTVLVPGTHEPLDSVPPPVLRALRAAARRGTRLASICTGAFVLAAAGLLDGRRATTHWVAAPLLARRHPAVTVDAAALCIDDGQVLTSGGAAAGIDLCLHLVRRDLGADAALQAARLAMVPLAREGGHASGQSAFIASAVEQRHAPASLKPLLDWALQHLGQVSGSAALAARAGVSVRTLHRRFDDELGSTPLQWLLDVRVRRAQEMLEASDWTVERIAEEAGFASALSLRQHFGRRLGTTPQGYRRAFTLALAGPPPRA